MLGWICPQCEREVDPALGVCPFCGNREAAPPKLPPARRGFSWADVDRGFRFGLGFITALAVAYLLLVLAAYYWRHDEWFDRLTRWLYGR